MLVFGGYLLIARIVGDFYPFSTFSMYANVRSTSASHVVVRDSAAALHEVYEYASFSCKAAIDVDPPRCRASRDFESIGYIDRDIKEYIEKYSTPNLEMGEPVELVRHIWRFQDGSGEVLLEDCLLQRCQAVRK